MNPSNISDGVTTSDNATNPLQLTMQMQLMSNWCWAATSSSINNFYFGGADPDNTQSKLVGKAFGGSCIIAPSSQSCDRPNTVSAGLILTKRYIATIPNSLPMTSIQSAINAAQPVAVGIISTCGGVSHTIAVIGYDNSANIVVKDPALGDGARVVPLAGFPANLYTSYVWRESCTTHA